MEFELHNVSPEFMDIERRKKIEKHFYQAIDYMKKNFDNAGILASI